MIISVFIGLAVGILFLFVMNIVVEQALLLPSQGARMIAGEIVCLPEKQFLLGQTRSDVCKIGLHDKENMRYYGLVLDEEHQWLYTAIISDEPFIVTGTVRKPTDSDSLERYSISGVIGNATSIDTLDGDTSIYEVRYRYGDELAIILDEAYSDTQYGYSVRTEECDREPCIAIVLDVYVSGLKEKIPEMINGYKVDIRCCLID